MKKGYELKTYLAGAVLANAPIWILSYPFLYSKTISNIVSSILIYIICFIDSAVASYLVARKLSKDYLKVGVMTGIFSYILYAIVTIILPPVGIQDLVIFIGFVIGGGVGARVWEKQFEGRL